MKNYLVKYAESYTFDLVLYDPITQGFQSSITWQSGDVKIIKDGIDAGNSTNTPSLVTGRNIWRLELTSGELTAKQVTIEFHDVVGTAFIDDSLTIQTYGHTSASIPNIPATIAVGAIATDAITSTQIADDSITANKIASNAITSSKIATGAITSATIADNAIGVNKIATGAIKNGSISSSELTNIAQSILKADWTIITGEPDYCLLQSERFIRNGFDTSGTTLVVYKEDGTTLAWTSSISADVSASPITRIKAN